MELLLNQSGYRCNLTMFLIHLASSRSVPMSRCLRIAVLALSFMALSAFPLVGQEDSGWCISPARINVQMGDDRALQLLDDSAQEIQTLSPTRIWRRACARCRDRNGAAPRQHAIFG